jgi:HD-GYP domain-containing protein (c-di-GMP phosphodiesterase class II)
MADRPPSDRVRTAEVIAALSLATDLAVGFPIEHGLHSAVVAMRLCDRLDVDAETAMQTYYMCLLFYVGCTAPADVGWEVFGEDDSLTRYGIPSRFGTRSETVRGFVRAVAPPTVPLHVRAWRMARHLPVLAVGFPGVVAATCEMARMLTDQLGLGAEISRLFDYESERWDGKGMPAGVAAEGIPLAVRIAHVARDATYQRVLGDADFAADVIGSRAGGAFDPAIARVFSQHAAAILSLRPDDVVWDLTLAVEPKPWLVLEGGQIDQALAVMGHFSEIAIPELVGHSGGVSELCRAAARVLGLTPEDTQEVCRAALIHDVGRAAVPARIWMKTSSLTVDDWEQVRLHAYQTERVLARSLFLAGLVPAAGLHHERLDGSGYHRGVGASALPPSARLLAAADAYHAMTEPRPHRPRLPPEAAARTLKAEARAGRLASDAVAGILDAAGHPSEPVERPAGLTEREAEVVCLLARGLQTKQVARSLGISAKTADAHIQNAYRKMGVSTRAGATVFAMQHGLVV